MKAFIAVLLLLSSSAAMAGSLECASSTREFPALRLSLADWSDVVDVWVKGQKRSYELTDRSKKVTRYHLPYVIFSDANNGLQLTVNRVGEMRELKAHLVFNYKNPDSKTYPLVCEYDVSE